MSKTKSLPIKNLAIDLHNFRTIPQKNELEAIKAMISISPDYFWGLMESLLDDGYLPTENIIVIEKKEKVFIVKEGNRRIASLKIILGLVDSVPLDLPQIITRRISGLSKAWLKENASVPCTIYSTSETDIVDRIVTRTHGKGQKAGRDAWETVARARHNKEMNGAPEPSLDLLEKYLEYGENITVEQKTRWAGKYNLSVLDEAIKKIAPRFGVVSSIELAKKYPSIPDKKPLDEIIFAIGMETLTFPAIRDSSDFAARFGLAPLPPVTLQPTSTGQAGDTGTSPVSAPRGGIKPLVTSDGGTPVGSNTPPASASGNNTNNSPMKPPLASATNDETSVKKALRSLKLFGLNRAKMVTVKNEMLKLKIKDNPIAFCFLLRSMFELSAKAYCEDQKAVSGAPKYIKKDGSDKPLCDVLRDIVDYLTQNKSDKQMVRLLHGPMTEISKPSGLLSITSLNQLVHNPSFTISKDDIPTLFANIFPLLDQMNK